MPISSTASRIPRLTPLILSSAIIVLLGLSSCSSRNRAAEQLAEDSATAQRFTSNLTFENITLEQADEQGRTLWKIRAERATYDKDKKVAQIENPTGELYQDGKAVFNIKASNGEVREDGDQVFLRGDIVATDIRNGVVLQGKEMEWKPKEDLLVVRNGITGTHTDANVVAQEAQATTRKQEIKLVGGVVATTKDPQTQLKADQALWQVKESLIVAEVPAEAGDRTVRIDRYINNQISDTALARRIEMNAKTKVAVLKEKVQMNFTEPPLQVAGSLITWNFNTQVASSTQPFTAYHQTQQVTLSANQGDLNIPQDMLYLRTNVLAVAQRNQSRLQSNTLDWNLSSGQVQANGNVIYQQADPAFELTGPTASGNLNDQTVVVQGGRVVTEIDPSELN